MSSTRRTAIIALLVVAAGSFAFATGATVLTGPADTFADDRIAVQPAEGPNGNYSYLNDDDEIVVDISATNPNLPADFKGVNPEALASADGIFTITHIADGDEHARVWINNTADDGSVTFTADGQSIEGSESAGGVTLGPNESVAVGLDIDTRGEVAGTRLGPDTFAIGVAPVESTENGGNSTQSAVTDGGTGPSIAVSSNGSAQRAFRASDVSRGDTLRFGTDGMYLDGTNVTLDRLDLTGVQDRSVELNAAGSPDPFDDVSALEAATTPRSMAYLALTYAFDSDDVDEMTLRFSADERFLEAAGSDPEDVTLFRQTADGDWDEITVETVDEDTARARGLSEDRVHFRATTDEFSTFAVARHVPRLDVTGASLDQTAVEPGGEATVRATVENGGGADGAREIELTAGGDVIENESVALDAGETTTVPLTAAFESTGEYDLAVDDTPAGTLTVGDPATGDGESGSAAAGGEDAQSASTPTEEPSGIDLESIAGLLALVLLVVAGVALVRRMPR